MELPLTPLALVERGVLAFPQRVAVATERFVWTYAQFAERAGRVAGALSALGLAPTERVALLAPNSAQALECYSAAAMAGTVLVPLNTRLSAEEYAYILAHSDSRALIVDASLVGAVEPALGALDRPPIVLVQGTTAPPPGAFAYDDVVAAAPSLDLDPDRVDERGAITLNYTSGTTARPKGVEISHRSAYLNTVNMVLALGLVREDVHLHVAPMFHANGWGFSRMGRPDGMRRRVRRRRRKGSAASRHRKDRGPRDARRSGSQPARGTVACRWEVSDDVGGKACPGHRRIAWTGRHGVQSLLPAQKAHWAAAVGRAVPGSIGVRRRMPTDGDGGAR